MTRVLVVEDEPNLREPLVYLLEKEGYEVSEAEDGNKAISEFRSSNIDLILLDLMLPGISGNEVCRIIRAESQVPIIMITAKDTEIDKVVGLEIGADDYLPKPFEPRELLARLKALLRRAAPEASGEEHLEFGRLVIDLAARQARLAGQVCDLTAHQFDLLVVLARAAGRVLTRDQIMDALKGHPLDAFDRSIDVHISRIRAVIEDDPRHPQRVLTVRGTGYVFARKQDRAEA